MFSPGHDEKVLNDLTDSLIEKCTAYKIAVAQEAFEKVKTKENIYPVLNQYIDESEGKGLFALMSFKTADGRNRILTDKLVSIATDPENGNIAYVYGNPEKAKTIDEMKACYDKYGPDYMKYHIPAARRRRMQQ